MNHKFMWTQLKKDLEKEHIAGVDSNINVLEKMQRMESMEQKIDDCGGSFTAIKYMFKMLKGD